MWWAFVTATTLGYGDVSPHTETARAVGAVVMIIGTGFVALLTAAAAQKFHAAEIKRDVEVASDDVHLSDAEILAELHRVHQQLDRLTAAIERRQPSPPQLQSADGGLHERGSTRGARAERPMPPR